MKKLSSHCIAWSSIGFCLIVLLSTPAKAQNIQINRTTPESEITPPVCDSIQTVADRSTFPMQTIDQLPVVKTQGVKNESKKRS